MSNFVTHSGWLCGLAVLFWVLRGLKVYFQGAHMVKMPSRETSSLTSPKKKRKKNKPHLLRVSAVTIVKTIWGDKLTHFPSLVAYFKAPVQVCNFLWQIIKKKKITARRKTATEQQLWSRFTKKCIFRYHFLLKNKQTSNHTQFLVVYR